MKVSRPGCRSGSTLSISRSSVVRVGLGAELDPDRVVDPRDEVDVRAVEVARALTHPDEVTRHVVRVAGAGVDAGHRPLVVQQQRLVRGVELDRAHRVEVGAAGGHEAHRLVDVAWRSARSARWPSWSTKPAVPVVHPAQVGETALGEGAHEVQRRRAGVVGADQPLRVGRAGLRREGEVVDHVAAVGRQGHPVAGLVVAAARLGVLARHPADLDDRGARAVGQHRRHLQDGLDPVADVVGGRGGERLGAVAALQDEGLTARRLGEPAAQDVALAGEHQRRIGRQRPYRVVQGAGVRPRGLLGGRKVTPGVEAGEDVGGCVDTHPPRVVPSPTATAPGPHPETAAAHRAARGRCTRVVELTPSRSHGPA